MSDETVSIILLRMQRWMILIRVLVAGAINQSASPDTGGSGSGNGSGMYSSGSLTISSAVLLRDIMSLLDEGYAALSKGDSQVKSTTVKLPTQHQNQNQDNTDSQTQAAVIDPQYISPARKAALRELTRSYDVLYSALPEHLLFLCRHLPSSEFTSLFNTEVLYYLSVSVYHHMPLCPSLFFIISFTLFISCSSLSLTPLALHDFTILLLLLIIQELFP